MPQTFTRIEYGEEKYYLLADLFEGGEGGFDLTICNGRQLWRETVSSSVVQSMAKAADMSVSEFAAQTGRALTGQATRQDNFVYQTKLRGKDLQFSWKKNIGDGVKFQLGSLTLAEVDNRVPITIGVFDLAVDQMAQLKEEITSLMSENARLSSEREEALKVLNECVTAKEHMETDLFEKFAAVLNEKKAKIRQLKEAVHETAMAAAADSVKAKKPSDSSKSQDKGKSSWASKRSDDTGDDTDDDNTDDDNTQARDVDTRNKQEGRKEKEPKTTAFNPSLLPEEEDEEIELTVKKRRRREPKPRESPASKLVLPKVTPIRKTPSTSSGESVTPARPRRQASDKSPPDADDLMAEM